MIRSSGQRLHCVRFLCLCALCLGASCAREAWLSSVMSRCVGVGFLACARHAQHFALQNGSIGPKLLNSPAARPHKKGLFIAKGEGAPGKGGFLSTFFGFCGVFHCSRCFWCTYWEHDCDGESFPVSRLFPRGRDLRLICVFTFLLFEQNSRGPCVPSTAPRGARRAADGAGGAER